MAMGQMNEELWERFMAWAEKQERVTYYKAITDFQHWTIEWFDAKAGFHYKEGCDLTTMIEEILRDGK